MKKIKHPLSNIILYLSGFLSTTAWADQQTMSAVQIKPLPTYSALSPGLPAASLVNSPQAEKIGAKISQNLLAISQPTSQKSRALKRQKMVRKARNPQSSMQISSRADGSVRQIKGGILEPAIENQTTRSRAQRHLLTATRFLRRNRLVLGIKNPEKELSLQTEKTDTLGRAHLKYSQRYQGLPVWPADIIVHLSPEGHVDLMNGAYAPTPRKLMSVKARVSQADAKKFALATVAPAKSSIKKVPELIFYYTGNTHKLAWKITIKENSQARWQVIVDAISGDVLLKYNEIMSQGVSGAGVDLLNQFQNLQLFEQSGTFFMVDTTKAMYDLNSFPPNPNMTRGGIFLFDAFNASIESSTFEFSLVSSSQPDRGFLPDAVSAAYNISETYDYFLERYNRNSLDNNGGSLSGVVRVGEDFDNAFWDGERMFFGDATPYAGALDVVAHELAHGVTQHTANLVYRKQSGALNEAFSDIFGEMVEARTRGNDWVLGTGLPLDSQRSLRDPSSLFIPGLNRPYPSKMSDFIITSQDNGGVHLNSGIINHAFYLLAEGLSNAIGIAEAERIFYRALTVHLVRNSQFIDARLATITSADELFGQNSIQSQKTAEAFQQVEILENIASTPPPSSIPAVNGEDSTLFICFNEQFSVNFLCRQEAGLDDPVQGVFLTKFDVLASRVSISGDGDTATFVDSLNDICFIRTNGSEEEDCLGEPGTVSSVAISPDRNLFGFILLDEDLQPNNFISVVDIRPDEPELFTYKLTTPSIDGGDIDNIVFADVMNFTADGRFIIYDALTEFTLSDGTKLNNWSIYALEMETGHISIITSANPGFNLSFPSLGHTNDNFMTFSLSEEGVDHSILYSANLNEGNLRSVAQADGVFSTPAYNGDDSAIIFDHTDSRTVTGLSLLRQGLASDHITSEGPTELWLEDATFGITYRRGDYVGVIEETGFYDNRTNTLRIHAVDVTDTSGKITTFQADLRLTSNQPLRFRLSASHVINTQREGDNARFDQKTGKVLLPRISLTDRNGLTQLFRAEMRLISDQLDFEITSLQQTQ